MEPNRFDDVEIRIVEEPAGEPPAPRRQRRLGRVAVALTVAAVTAGTLAAGASALTSTAQAPTRPAVKAKSFHQGCHRGEGHRWQSSATTLNY
jgi:hypothetical protein